MTGRAVIEGVFEPRTLWPADDGGGSTLAVFAERLTFESRAGAAQTIDLRRASVDGAHRVACVGELGDVRVRLEGVDVPELRYTPAGAAEMTGADGKTIAAPLYRQQFAESAARALANLFGRKLQPVRCTCESSVADPAEGFDTFGRFVGRLVVHMPARDLDVGAWLLAGGWGVPAFYESMSAAEIASVRDAARSAQKRRRGLWSALARDLNRFDGTEFQHGLAATVLDDGPLILPKLFRRQAAWAWAVLSAGYEGTLEEYLVAHPLRCFATADFTARGLEAKEHDVAALLRSGAIDVFDPFALVHREAPARLVVER